MNEEVLDIQEFLKKAGYLKDDYLQGHMDGPTINALLDFKKRHDSHVINQEFLERWEESNNVTISKFFMYTLYSFATIPKIQDISYFGRKRFMKYGFSNFPDSLPPELCRSALRNAFDMWQHYINIDFGEDENPDISIAFHDHEIQDGCDFGQVGGHLAKSDYPPSVHARHEKVKMHFDAAECWNPDTGGRNLEVIAAHEVGHILGLRHSDIPSDLMYKGDNPAVIAPAENDIRRITNLYGRRGPDLLIKAHDIHGNVVEGVSGELIQCDTRITAFMICPKKPQEAIALEYCAFIDDELSPWVSENTLIGNPGGSTIQGFAVRIKAAKVPLRMAYLAFWGDTNVQMYYEGRLCGRQGLSPISGMLVQMEVV